MIDKFKKGDYIVVIRDDDEAINNWTNYCLLVCQNDIHLHTNLDPTGKYGVWNNQTFSNKTFWRYATKEEIEEYDRLEKPFKVTEFIPKKVTQDYSYLESFLNNLNIK